MTGVNLRIETKEAFQELMADLMKRNIVTGSVRDWYRTYESALVKESLFPMDIPLDPNCLLKLLDKPLIRAKYTDKARDILQPKIVELLT